MTELIERLAGLARWLSRFEDPAFTTGDWHASTTEQAGVIHMPWYEYGTEIRQFTAEMAALGWVHPFDWMAWAATPAGRRLLQGPASVASADAEDLSRLLTTIVRGDRFSEGEIAGAFEAGMLTAIARRAQVLMGENPR
jgi:hypothetical protein